jgi:cation:H+ antiporter
MWAHLLILIVGLAILGFGGEFLVRGAAHLARQMGVSALVVALTIVAFGTSMPEIAVTLQSAHDGQDDLAIANVVGSCIMNLWVVLGISALISPLRVARNVTRVDAPVMLFFTAVFVLFAIDNQTIERWQGLFFVAALAVYTLFTYNEARRQPQEIKDEYEHDPRQSGKVRVANSALLILGIVGLIKGADLIVSGAVGIAEMMGVSTRIIGLTIVALGTSLPELTTCVIAARRGQPDIAIGNIVGSNIFNILAVIGITATIIPLDIARETLYFDAPVMLLATLLIIPILRTGRRITRKEGAMMLVLYALYLGWILK